MNDREAALRDLLTDLDIIHGDLSDTGDLRQSAGADRDRGRVLSEGTEIGLLQLLLKVLDLILEVLLLLLLEFELFLQLLQLCAG